MRAGDGAHPEKWYAVASVSRIDKMIGLFCKKPYKRDYVLQETYNLVDPTNRSHSICFNSMCDMPHSDVRHDSLHLRHGSMRAIRMRGMPHLNINDDNSDIT